MPWPCPPPLGVAAWHRLAGTTSANNTQKLQMLVLGSACGSVVKLRKKVFPKKLLTTFDLAATKFCHIFTRLVFRLTKYRIGASLCPKALRQNSNVQVLLELVG